MTAGGAVGPLASHLTLDATLEPGETVSPGELASYRRLALGRGEPRLTRLDLVSRQDLVARQDLVSRQDLAADRPGAHARQLRSLAHLAQVSDLQLADVQSPARIEFLEFLRGLPGTGTFVPAQRPQETLVSHAVEMTARTLDACVSRETGAGLDLVVSTGDNIDSAQWNELQWFISLMSGGEIDRRVEGSARYEGVQLPDWPTDLFWRPDGGTDRWSHEYGFPRMPGLLELALVPFQAAGFSCPWISCFGNHDGMPFGESVPTSGYREILEGTEKVYGLPAGFDAMEHESFFFDQPELFFSGPSRPVPSDAGRRVVGRREFVEAHLKAPGRPAGHGFTDENLSSGTTYFSYEASPILSVIALDTTNLDGFHNGSIGERQFRWLEGELLARHSSCLSEDGRPMRGEGDDRLVVLASHHGSRRLTNLRQSQIGAEDDHPRFGREQVLSLLGRFRNIVCWLNGHTHVNEIELHRTPAGGFAEITTCSIADWPSQSRLVELVSDDEARTVSVLTTMVNHSAPLVPCLDEPSDVSQLASLHRELAANAPFAGFGAWLEGEPRDRNCEIVLPAPFALPT